MNKLLRGLQFYYILAIVIIFSCALGIFSYFWKSNLMNVNYISSLFESITIIENFDKGKNVENVKFYIERDQVGSAIKLFERIEKNVQNVMSIQDKSESKDLLKHFVDLKKELNALISYPEISSLLSVIWQKVDSFHTYAGSNDWKVLTRMSSALGKKVKINRRFDFESLNDLRKNVNRNLTVMRNITSSSILDNVYKNKIFLKLEELNVELKMLEKYMSDLKVFNKKYTVFAKSFNQWKDKVFPELVLEKALLTKKSKTMVFYLLGLMGVIFLLLIFGIPVYRSFTNKNVINIENHFIDLIHNMVISPQFSVHKDFSDNFHFQARKKHQYVQKRMSYSLIFQDTLPFPAIMLNTNLKIVWANSPFCNFFKMNKSEIEHESFSWDYISRFTNLTEQNPVLDAFKNNIYGIFQVKVRVDQNKEVTPYEMYVCPYKEDEVRSVMIFFYPLVSMEETIRHQGEALLSPIRKILDSFKGNTFTDEIRKDISQEFDNAGIKDVYQKFTNFYEISLLQKQSLLREIDKLEQDLKDNYQLITDMKCKNDHYKNLQVELFNSLGNMKKYLVSYVDLTGNYHEIGTDLLSIYRNIMKHTHLIGAIAKEFHSKISGTKAVVGEISKVKEDFKKLRSNINHLNTKLCLSLDKIMAYNHDYDDLPINSNFNIDKLKSEIQNINHELTDLDKIVTFLDVQISKGEMILGHDINKEDNIDNIKRMLSDFDKQVEENFFKKSRLLQKTQVLEDKMVKSLENFYECSKANIGHFNGLNEMIGQFLQSDDTSSNIKIKGRSEKQDKNGPQKTVSTDSIQIV